MEAIFWVVAVGFLLVSLLWFIYDQFVKNCVWKIYEFLFTPDWKTLDDCIEAGFSKKLTPTILQAYYNANHLQVRFDEHFKTCDDCQNQALLFLFDSVDDITIKLELEDSVPEDVKEADVKQLLLTFFEQSMFCADTAGMFEFRITTPTKKRRRRKWLPEFRLPSWAAPQPI